MIIDFSFFFVLVLVLIYIHIKQFRYRKTSEDLIKMMDKHVNFLTDMMRKKEVEDLKNMINLYAEFQTIFKISKANYLSFFKYDFSKRYILLHFILSIDDKGSIIQNSMLDRLPASSNLLTLRLLKADGDDLYDIEIDKIEEIDKNIHDIMKSRGIKKIYYQNIYKDVNRPFGYIAISFKDKDYVMPDGDKIEILRIIEKVKHYI